MTHGHAKPDGFLEVRVRDMSHSIPLIAACAGYELGVWRSQQLARHMMYWLPEFALSWKEQATLNHANALERVQRAAQLVYSSPKFQSRGEFGELLLHILIRDEYNSTPAISKIFFKTSPNDTVKGFDAVHVVGTAGELELWLGEAKFYENGPAAIRDAIESVRTHLGADYLRQEFIVIRNHLDLSWPHAAEIGELLKPSTSLDTVFRRIVVPVLITYDSSAVGAHKSVTADFLADFEHEVRELHQTFTQKSSNLSIRVVLFLVPMDTKAILAARLDEELKKLR